MERLIPLPAWTTLLGFMFGAIVGSFLNVVIYRMPRGKSLSNPKHSFCPKCGHQLHTADLFPLLSWLFSGRKCRYCGQPVIARYFWVEMLNGLIWGGVWYQYLLGMHPDLGKAIAYALAASALVAIIFIDIELYLIPDQINAFILFVGLGYNVWLYSQGAPGASTWGIPSSIAGALVGVGVLWGIAFFGRLLFRKDAMGHGDIKMARGTGAVLFPAVAGISFGLAVILGAVIGIIQIVARKSSAKGIDESQELDKFFKEIGSHKPLTAEQVAKVAALHGPSVAEVERITAAGGSSSKEELKTFYEGLEKQFEAILTPKQFERFFRPESLGSLLKSGIGYILCFDVIGLFVPKFAVSYFGESPYDPPEDLETFEPDQTMIPFGPYLALGAILAAVFEVQLLGVVTDYLRSVSGEPAFFWNTF